MNHLHPPLLLKKPLSLLHDNVRPYEEALATFQEFLRSQEAILEGAPQPFPPAGERKDSAGDVSDTTEQRQKPSESEFVIPVYDQSEKTEGRDEEGEPAGLAEITTNEYIEQITRVQPPETLDPLLAKLESLAGVQKATDSSVPSDDKEAD